MKSRQGESRAEGKILTSKVQASKYIQHLSQYYMFSLHSVNQIYTSDQINRFERMTDRFKDGRYKLILQKLVLYLKNKDINMNKKNLNNKYDKLKNWKVRYKINKVSNILK